MRPQIFICLLFLSLVSFAQQGDSIPNPAIQIIARAQQEKIMLRWAINDAALWQRGNTYGYTLERFTVYRDGKRLETPEQKILATTPLKPAPLEAWETMALADDNAAILAQAIYGDTFEIGTAEGELMAIVNKVKALEQRFSFALFAADMNFTAAKLAGLGYEDSTIKANEGYLYRLRSAIPTQIATVKEGTVHIEASATEGLPAPIDLVGVFEDKSVLLTWEYELFKTIYTTYHVERSEDGTSYTRLGDLPIVNLNNKEDAPTKRMYYIDTIPQNNKKYHYRVLGVSPFGEEGAVSKAISGKGQKALTASPFITNHVLQGENAAQIAWEFPVEKENEVAEFQVRSAAKDNGTYETLKKGITPAVRNTKILLPQATNYIKVVAIGKDSTETSSFSALVQVIDSIPPAMPKGLVGIIDSLGITKISWEANTEKDLLGYRVFRGNLKQEEYAQITVSPIATTMFTDTLQVKSLNDKVFYTVVAVDQRFNNSVYSEAIALKKPDVIPPSAPIFKDYKISSKGVALSWIRSSSSDVEKHQLYRAIKAADSNWELIWETKDTIASYTDTSVLPSTKYSYKIQAQDDSALISLPSPYVTIETATNTDDKLIKGLNTEVDRVNNSIKIYWKKNIESIKEIVIYKSKREGNPSLLKQIPATLHQVIDTKISPSNAYIYHLRPVLANGSYGAMQTLEVNY